MKVDTNKDVMESSRYRFDQIDHRSMRIRGQLTPGERLQAMMAAREWVFSAMRSRITRRYPTLTPEEINLKVLEELDHAERRAARPQSLP
jgi:hypothetical protein